MGTGGLLNLLGGLVACMIAGAIGGLAIWPPRERRPRSSLVVASGTGAPDSRDFAAERDRLVRGCMDLADHLRDDRPTLFRRALRDLADVGVAPVVPDGERVDESHHDVIGAKPTLDAAVDRTVASTERMGFTDRGTLVRRPQVVIWQGPEVLR